MTMPAHKRDRNDMHMFYDMNLHYETERAIRVSIDGDPSNGVWLPKSQIKWVKKDNSFIDVNVPEWLAVDKGLA